MTQSSVAANPSASAERAGALDAVVGLAGLLDRVLGVELEAQRRARRAARRDEGHRRGARRGEAGHVLGRLLGAPDGEHDVETGGRRMPVVADLERVGGLIEQRAAGGVESAGAQVGTLVGLLADGAGAGGRAQKLAALAVPAEVHLRAEPRR